MCCQHLAENVHKEFGKEARQLFWPIARAKTTQSFNIAVRKLKEANPKAERYLN
jgi:hypothetical protein